jgi:hypothetical protein
MEDQIKAMKILFWKNILFVEDNIKESVVVAVRLVIKLRNANSSSLTMPETMET